MTTIGIEIPLWTEEDLAALNDAIKNGVKSVDYPGGHSVEYQTLNDMLKLRRLMILEINSQLTGGKGQYKLARFQ